MNTNGVASTRTPLHLLPGVDQVKQSPKPARKVRAEVAPLTKEDAAKQLSVEVAGLREFSSKLNKLVEGLTATLRVSGDVSLTQTDEAAQVLDSIDELRESTLKVFTIARERCIARLPKKR
jgi:hypothetical protein